MKAGEREGCLLVATQTNSFNGTSMLKGLKGEEETLETPSVILSS